MSGPPPPALTPSSSADLPSRANSAPLPCPKAPGEIDEAEVQAALRAISSSPPSDSDSPSYSAEKEVYHAYLRRREEAVLAKEAKRRKGRPIVTLKYLSEKLEIDVSKGQKKWNEKAKGKGKTLQDWAEHEAEGEEAAGEEGGYGHEEEEKGMRRLGARARQTERGNPRKGKEESGVLE